MIKELIEYLEVFVTENGIPLKQVLTKQDVIQLAVSINALTTPKEYTDFNNINDSIFKLLKNERNDPTYYPIIKLALSLDNDNSLEYVSLLGYYCLQYLKLNYNLPVKETLLVLNSYMKNHIVNAEDCNKIDCNNPLSNLIPISEDTYIKYNGREILPPTKAINNEFIEQIKKLTNNF